MPDFDPYSIQLADEPTALEMARARAAALRGQNYAGLVGSLAHDPYAARSGAALMHEAQQGLQDLGQAPGERMRQALGRQNIAKGEREAAPYTDPTQAGILAQGQQAAAKMMGVNIPEGATPTTGQLFLSAFEKPYEQQQNRLMREALARTSANAKLQAAGVGPGGGGTLSPEAIDQWAELSNTTGTPPPRSLGPANIKAVLNRMAALHPDSNLAENKATNKAAASSLASQQKILDNTESWERTGKANLNTLLGIAQKLHDTGSPWLNRPVREFFEKGAGDPNQTAFKAAHNAVVNEYAKILSGSTGSGGVTEGARHEAESMLPLDATMQQLTAAAQLLNTDADNRVSSLRQQYGHTKALVSGKPETDTSTTAAPVRKFKRENGKLVEVK
jgi:hypothetical protein